jgi:hypothetical protein
LAEYRRRDAEAASEAVRRQRPDHLYRFVMDAAAMPNLGGVGNAARLLGVLLDNPGRKLRAEFLERFVCADVDACEYPRKVVWVAACVLRRALRAHHLDDGFRGFRGFGYMLSNEACAVVEAKLT